VGAVTRLAQTSSALALAASAFGCGTSSGPVLERVEPRVPPEANLRADVLLVRRVDSCAIGSPCDSRDPENCFHLSDEAGPVLLFEPSGLDFVPLGDERIATAELSGCFGLDIDDEGAAALREAFDQLRTRVFQLSEGRIDIEFHVADIGPVAAGFKRWEGGTGLFLEPFALEAQGLPLLGAETDYTFAVTGVSDLSGGYLPKIEPCGGTNWEQQGGLGGAAYTWLSADCVSASTLLWHLHVQTRFGLRDVNEFPDVYAGQYPDCGAADADPSSWFPGPEDCAVDPDSPTCGERCGFGEEFESHVLKAHFPASFIGNHCANGLMDWDETGVDSGGICDRLGR
jgi:hypothetical protein